MADTDERVVLGAPRGGLALSAMRVVVGWVASCHDLPLDSLDDVNLAIEALLADETQTGGPLSLTLSVKDGVFEVLVAGLENSDLHSALRAVSPFEPSVRCPLDVSLFLRALVDSYTVVPGDTNTFGVKMQKRIP